MEQAFAAARIFALHHSSCACRFIGLSRRVLRRPKKRCSDLYRQPVQLSGEGAHSARVQVVTADKPYLVPHLHLHRGNVVCMTFRTPSYMIPCLRSCKGDTLPRYNCSAWDTESYESSEKPWGRICAQTPCITPQKALTTSLGLSRYTFTDLAFRYSWCV